MAGLFLRKRVDADDLLTQFVERDNVLLSDLKHRRMLQTRSYCLSPSLAERLSRCPVPEKLTPVGAQQVQVLLLANRIRLNAGFSYGVTDQICWKTVENPV